MMSHAARKNMDEAILLAGDMDFTPVVESLVDLGLTVTVMADAQTVANELTWAADAFHELTLVDYYAFASGPLKQKYPLPAIIGVPSPPDAAVLKKGRLGDIVRRSTENSNGTSLALALLCATTCQLSNSLPI